MPKLPFKTPKLVTVEDDGSARAELEQRVAEMWAWLRDHLDKAAVLYQQTGDPNHAEGSLQQCLAGDAYEKVVAHLDALRSHGLIWRYDHRGQSAGSRIKVEEVVGNTYVVTEYFRDFSTQEWWSAEGELIETRQAEGHEYAIRATIFADQGSYWITELAMLSEDMI